MNNEKIREILNSAYAIALGRDDIPAIEKFRIVFSGLDRYVKKDNRKHIMKECVIILRLMKRRSYMLNYVSEIEKCFDEQTKNEIERYINEREEKQARYREKESIHKQL